MQFPSTTPSVKMGYRNARRRFCNPKFKIIFPLMMRRAKRSAFKIVPFFCALPQAAKQCIIGAERYNAGNPG